MFKAVFTLIAVFPSERSVAAVANIPVHAFSTHSSVSTRIGLAKVTAKISAESSDVLGPQSGRVFWTS